MVFCPNCGAENADSAKFCKQCGHALSANRPIKDNYVSTGIDPSARANDNNYSSQASNNSNSKSDNKNLIIICLTIVICAILIAGALVMFSNNDANDSDNTDVLSDSASLSSDSINDSTDTVETDTQTAQASSLEILGGTFSTGSSASDKTYCTVYVGSEHAGEKVKISVLYSNDGYTLNQGKIVSKTVSSDGYVKVASANPLDYYPDDAYITLYDNDGNVVDTQEVYLSASSGKQTF